MKDRLLAIWNSIKTTAESVWSSVSSYLAKIATPALSVLAVIGAVLAIAEYKSLIIKLISWKAGSELKSAEKESSDLTAKEDADKQTEQQAEQRANNEPNPGDDWYKKK